MFKKLKQKFSVLLAKKPATVVLLVILLLNVVFLCVAALIIAALSLSGTENMSFWEAAFYTVTMILDAGCISFVIEDIGQAGVALVIVCLVVIIIGMVLFTGAVIGYLTNYISKFIENANVGMHKVKLSDHVVILNWNSRASEIVNDLMYSGKKQYVVILVANGKEDIERELDERLSDTVAQEKNEIKRAASGMKGLARLSYLRKHKFKNRIITIVREGDTFSTKQLNDISLSSARSIIILGSDINNSVCKFDVEARRTDFQRGNPQTIKALVQVAEITSAESSSDNQKIVVEVEDDWTLELVNNIIAQKQVDGKCNIIPVCVNQILGRLLSQFSLMPELNLAYKELFSNKGMTFYSKPFDGEPDEERFTSEYLSTHNSSLPLCLMKTNGILNAYFAADSEHDDQKLSAVPETGYAVKLNQDYNIERKNIIILGHNSKIKDIMSGFDSFRDEWGGNGADTLNIIVIDDKTHLERMDYYKAYPYVTNVVEADIFDRDVICKTIKEFVDANETDTSVLIVSDDTVPNEQIDSDALANLIYVSDIVRKLKAENPSFDPGKLDVIVEILNPKHYDIVKSYSVNNVVISNRYISKMITQLGEKDTLFDFYNDILSYDSADADAYESKEIYIKKVGRFFDEVPAPATAGELVRAVYHASVSPELPKSKQNHTIVLGCVKSNGKMEMFSGNLSKIKTELDPKDKLIMYSVH